MLAIAHSCRSGQIPAEVAVVIADTPAAGGLERARALGLADRASSIAASSCAMAGLIGPASKRRLPQPSPTAAPTT